ncbi:MAG TPA: hypothetical protein VL359_10000, partial [bacterium]|nr:hypothetical protein [bacterium]
MRLTARLIPVSKLLLLLALSALLTLLIVPRQSLVPSRFQAGDVVPHTITIPDNITLEDEHSTELRRQQALQDFAPIYDFDAGLKSRTLDALASAFQRMRATLATSRQQLSDNLVRLRQNSLDRLSVMSSLDSLADDLNRGAVERNNLLHETGLLEDLAQLTPAQADALEKLRFGLRAVDARRVAKEAQRTQLKARLAQLDDEGRRIQAETAQSHAGESQSIVHLKTDFETILGLSLVPEVFRPLLDAQFGPDTEAVIHDLLAPVLDQKIVATREGLPAPQGAIQLRNLETSQQERFEALNTLVDLQDARRQLAKTIQAGRLPSTSAGYKDAVLDLAQRLVRPNVTENKGETERQRQDLWKNTSPVYFNLKKGDVVAKAGDIATPQQAEIIKALNAYNLNNPKYPQLLGTFLIVALTLTLLYQLSRQRSGAKETRLASLVLMSIVLLATL